MIVRRVRVPTARRIAVVADSHGALADDLVAAMACTDLIVHAGDIGARAVLRALAAVAPVRAVAGNNDVPHKWPSGEASFCARLPSALELELDGGQLIVIHGHQWPAVSTRHRRLRECFPAARCIAYGHSHHQVIDTDSAPWVINPGACGRVRTFGGASWLGLTIVGDQWLIGRAAFIA